MSKPTPLLDRFTFQVELDFPEEAEVVSEQLSETIVAAICEYDTRHRLAPGKVLEGGEPPLTGISITFIRHERAQDVLNPLRGREPNPNTGNGVG